MATQHRSMTLDDIDFKIRCIAHYSKVYFKVNDPTCQAQMLAQTIRANREIIAMIGNDPKISRAARKMRDKLHLKEFIAMALTCGHG
jgi:hypothetical protein